MQFGWQELVACIVVALAAGYLVRRSWRLLSGSKSGGCSSCSRCGTMTAGRNGDVIPVESLVKPAKD